VTSLTPQQHDRAVGVLLASAAGDALGVPYEFGVAALFGEPEQIGGGLGGIAPGQWSDDTEMACVIAEVAATGADLRTPEALEAVAQGFLRWIADGPAAVGAQTRHVLRRTGKGAGAAVRMTAAAEALHQETATRPATAR